MQTGSVKGLSPREQRKVCVCLTRIWENKNKENKMYELGRFFIDQQGNMIEGCLPENNMQRFSDKLKESLLYEISSFIVVAARNSYRVAEHAFRIKIGQQTKIREIDPPLEDFPFYAYNAKPFDTLEKRMKETNVLSDVIGIAFKVTEVLTSKSGHESRRHIFIKNESDRTAVVTLWGELAESFNARSLYEASIEKNVPVLFMGMVVDYFSGAYLLYIYSSM
ncbi:unnamed protein product [Alopecurus aequalis]